MNRTTDMPRGTRMARMYAYLVRNRTRSFSAADMHAWINGYELVSLRNVQRDLQALAQLVDTSVIAEPGPGKTLRYRIEPDMRNRLTLPVERNGLLALFMLKRVQQVFSPKGKTLADLGTALSQMSHQSDSDLFDDLDQRLGDQTLVMGEQATLPLNGVMLDSLLKGLVERKRLIIRYQNDLSKGPYQRTICPVKLILYKSDLYFVCMSENHPERNYYIKLCRIESVIAVGTRFAVSAERLRAIDERLSNSFGILDEDVPKPQKVVLRFPPWFGLILTEKRYHHSQIISTTASGETLCEITVPVDKDLVQWVLSWGDNVTAQKPAKLQNLLRDTAQKLVERYAG